MNCTMRFYTTTFGFAVITFLATARADDLATQKAAAEANIKKAGLTSLTSVETDDLLIYAGVPPAKAKSLADALQKTSALSRTTLKFAADEQPWPGKLTVYVLTDAAQFTNFVRLVEQRRPDKGIYYSINVRGDVPYVVHSVTPGERVSDAELMSDAAALVGAAVVNRKAGAGTVLPEWLSLGFGRTIAIRSDSNPTRLSNYRSRARAAVLGTRTRPAGARLADVWGGIRTKDTPVITASLVEYLAFGPEAEKFSRFLAAFQPSDENPEPSAESALAALEWQPEALELGWKQWVARQR